MGDDERREAARAALAYLAEMTPGLRGAEITTADGTVLATRGASLEGRLEQEGGDESDGRAFTVSEQGLSLTAITEPAAPPTLTELDLRIALSTATHRRWAENRTYRREIGPSAEGGGGG